MRDSIKNKLYFDDFILEDSKRIDSFNDKLKNGLVPAGRIDRIKEKVISLEIGIFIAKYSRGDSLKSLYDSFLGLFDEWSDLFDENDYNINLKMISLAILFNYENKLNDIKDKLSKIDDWLITYILDGENRKKLVYPEHYEALQNILKNKDFSLLHDYVKNDWFNEDLDCFVSHKSAENTYSGYWCFEVAAIIKKLGIDDSELKNAKFYPYELVHF